jgi:hypothetical protein
MKINGRIPTFQINPIASAFGLIDMRDTTCGGTMSPKITPEPSMLARLFRLVFLA